MKKLLLSITLFFCLSIYLTAGIFDSLYNNVKNSFEQAGDSLSYYKKCDDKKNAEYFQMENTNLREVLYVSSVTGTNIKEQASSSSKTLCVAPLNLPVRLLKVEKKDTVNNSTSYWIKIYIPSFLQKQYNCAEYGYIFGNYLSHEIVDLKELPANFTKESLNALLQSGIWNNKNEAFLFKSDQTYKKYDCSKKTFSSGKWEVKDNKTIILNSKEFSVNVNSYCDIQINNASFEKKYNQNFINDKELENEAAFFQSDKNGMNAIEFLNIFSTKEKATDKVYKYGLSAKRTLFEDEVEEKWRSQKGEKREFYDEVQNKVDLKAKLKSLSKDKKYTTCFTSLAKSLETPVPYFIFINEEKDKTSIIAYSLKGEELIELCNLSESVTSEYKNVKVEYYFDRDNFNVNFYGLEENGALSLINSYVCKQNVNDVYSFSVKKLKK